MGIIEEQKMQTTCLRQERWGYWLYLCFINIHTLLHKHPLIENQTQDNKL